MIIQVLLPKRTIEDYRQYIDPQIFKRLSLLSKELKGAKIVHVNSTANGGGVVEYLKGLVPFLNAFGIDTSWIVITPPMEFFEVTKSIHNALQGNEVNFDSSVKQIYQDNSIKVAEELHEIKIQADLWVMHDPQTLLLKTYLPEVKEAIWRCHIDTAKPYLKVWKFLLPFIRGYDYSIFSLPEYVNSSIDSKKAVVFPPAIDPMAVHNWPISRSSAQEIIAGFGIDTAKPLITQVSRFDIFKDPLGVVDAYKLAKRQIPDLQLAFVTKFADDDPEAQQIYQQILKYVGSDSDVHFIINPSNNYVVLNAFQTSSDIIIQKSIKEGFGLTVTEAMFKGRPVIGGNAGGIKLQIQDGINGFIVKSSAECSVKIVELLKSPNLAKTIGENARKSAQHFLIPTLALNYLEIFAKILLTSAKYNLYKEENIKSSLYAGDKLSITADSE